MNQSKIRMTLRLAAAVLATAFSMQPLQAAPYATSLTNNAGVISFRLNESANAVAVIFTNLTGSTVISNLGPKTIGLTVTNLSVPGNFTISVTNSANPGYVSGTTLQISNDGTNGFSTNTLRFNAPRGIAINQNPASPYFGRIYVANSVVGSTTRGPLGDGIFVLNADYSDTFGQGTNARTAGITAFTNTAPGSTDDGNTPWHIELGEDDQLYISDFSITNGCIYVTDPNVATGTNVLAGFGAGGLGAPNASPNHGRIGSSVIAKGSLANGNLVLYAIDADTSATSDSAVNHIMKWPIGSGPLPVDLAVGEGMVVTNVDNSTLLNISGVTVDLAAGPDGKFYPLQNRSAGGEGGIFVIDPTVDGSAFDPTPDGKWDEVYDSHSASIVLNGFDPSTPDILLLSRAVKISPDGLYMAIIRDDNQIWVIQLVNGLPDLTTRKLVATLPATSFGRDICFDAADNIYTVSSGQAVMRAYSPGYKTVAQTSSQGTFVFTNILPATTVTVAATDPNAAEPGGLGGDIGTFTFSRTGDTSQPLVVNYSISGSATRGLDYVTNGASGAIPIINGTITIASGVSDTNVTIDVVDDALGETNELVIFTLQGSTNYLVGGTSSATVTIADDGDLPAISVKSLGGSYELLPGRPAKFNISTPLNAFGDLTVNISLTGTAISSVDYTNPTSFSVTLLQGITSTNFTVTPYGHSLTNSKTIVASVTAGSGYVLSTPASATNVLRADYLPPTTTLFADNFDTDTSANWKSNSINTDNDATFNYDYKTADGVPSAPHSTGGTTRGLRLRSHLGALAPATAISVTPIGQSFTGDFRLRFDLWMNYNGPMPGGGTGSSEYFTTGLGVSETRTNVAGQSAGTPIAAWGNAAGSAVFFEVDGDGGFTESTGDYIAFTNNVAITGNTNVYPAGVRDNFNAYYAEFGEIPAPAAQLSLFPNQTGLGQIGSLSFSWHDVVITKQGSVYSWTIDGLPIATVNYGTPTVGSNISLGYQDINPSITGDARMNTAIVDNLIVESLPSSQPMITSVAVINAGVNVQIDFTGNPADAPSLFILQSSPDVAGPYADVSATLTSTGSGTFRAVRAVSGNQQFYRIKR